MPDPDTTHAEIQEARANVSSAMEELLSLEVGHPVIVTDWLTIAEHTDGDGLDVRLTYSPRMTPWKSLGLAKLMQHIG